MLYDRTQCSNDAMIDIGSCQEGEPFPFGGYNTYTETGDPYICIEMGYAFIGLGLHFSDYIGTDPCESVGFDSVCCPCTLLINCASEANSTRTKLPNSKRLRYRCFFSYHLQSLL